MNAIRFTHPKKLLAFGALVFALSGCSSTGIPSIDNGPSADVKYSKGYVANNLKEGKTTSAEVKQKFGAPASADELYGSDGTHTTWHYSRNSEGVSGLVTMAHKYAPTQVSQALWGTTNNMDKATDVMNDAGTVTGTHTADQRTSYNGIDMTFVNGVLRSYVLH